MLIFYTGSNNNFGRYNNTSSRNAKNNCSDTHSSRYVEVCGRQNQVILTSYSYRTGRKNKTNNLILIRNKDER